MATRLAFYGAGEAAQPYLRALGRRPDVAVVAVCDPDRRAADQVAAGWNARTCPTPLQMLDDAPDALWVCVPPRLHGTVLTEAARRKIPFLVEPPGAPDFATARACADEVLRARLVTAVGFAGRYADVTGEAREYLGGNAVPLAQGCWLRPPGPDTPGKTVADLLWYDACRLVDGLCALCGSVQQVRALAAGAEKVATIVQLEFGGGTIATLTCAPFAQPAPRTELELLGDGWSLRLAGGWDSLTVEEPDKTTTLRRLNDPHADLAAAFLQAVIGGDPAAVAPGYADVLHTLAVCAAAAQSIAEGRVVTLEEVENAAGG